MSELALFASPAVPIAALGMPLAIYLPPFYAEELRLGLPIVGAVFMVTRLWDVVTDVLFGAISDRVDTRWGRRRPAIALATPIILLAVWRLFMPPSDVGAWHLAAWLGVLYVGWTLLTLSHMAWASELSRDYHVRSRLQGWREGGLVGGMILVLLLPVLVERQLGGAGSMRAAAIGGLILVLLPITVTLAVSSVPELRVQAREGSATGLRAFRIALTNRHMLRVLLTDLSASFATGVSAALVVFFIEHVVEEPGYTSLFLLSYFIVGFASVPLWLRVSYRFGKHRTLAAAFVYAACTLPLATWVGAGDVGLFFCVIVAQGLGYGAPAVLLRSITSDVTDDDERKSGRPRAGMFFALLTSTNKIGLAAAIGVSYALLDLVRFAPDIDNSAGAIDGLRAIYIALPSASLLVAGVVISRFRFDERAQRAAREALLQTPPRAN